MGIKDDFKEVLEGKISFYDFLERRVYNDSDFDNYEIEEPEDFDNNRYSVDFINKIDEDDEEDFIAGKKCMKRKGILKGSSGTSKDTFMGEDARKIITKEISQEDPKIHLGFNDKGMDVKSHGTNLSDFDKHGVIFGRTGTGKTTLMTNILKQISMNGNNFIFVTPKDSDSYDILKILDEKQLEKTDVLYPGSGITDKRIAINPLEVNLSEEDEIYEKIIDNKKKLMKNLILSEFQGGAIIEPVTETLSRETMKKDEKYSIIELIDILINEDARDEFVDNNELIYEYTDKVKDFDSSDLDSLMRRIKPFDEESGLRETFIARDGDINWRDYIEGDRNLIVDLSNLDEKELSGFGVLILISLWNAARIRNKNIRDEQERNLVTVMIDEFHTVITENNYKQTNIKKFFSEARSYQMGMIVASQFPDQIPKEVLKEIRGNTKLRVGFNTQEGTSTVSGFFPDNGGKITNDDITSLDDYKFYFRENNKNIKVSAYPSYPYLRNTETVEKIIKEKIEEKGSESVEDVLERKTGKRRSSITNLSIIGNVEKLKASELCLSVKIGSYKNDNDFVDLEEVYKILEKMYPEKTDFEYGELSNILERKNRYFEFKEKEDKFLVKLSKKGEEKAEQDSGKSGSAGKISHRNMLNRIQKRLSKHNIAVKIPEQEGPDDQGDAIGYKFGETLNKLNQLIQKQNDNKITIETESSTINNPSRMIKNYVKTYKNGNYPLFVVKKEKHAEKLYKIISEKPYMYSKIKKDKGKLAYNKNPLSIEKEYNETINPVFEKGFSSRWYVNNKLIKLYKKKGSKEEKILEFKLIKNNGKHITEKEFKKKIEDNLDKFDKIKINKDGNNIIKDPETGEKIKYDKNKYTNVSKPLIPEITLQGNLKYNISDTLYVIVMNYEDFYFYEYNKEKGKNKIEITEDKQNKENFWKDKI